MADFRDIPAKHWRKGWWVAFDIENDKVKVIATAKTLGELPPGHIVHRFTEDAPTLAAKAKRLFSF